MKALPRIPAVKRPEDFWAFSKAGRKLADLHVEYENVEPYGVTFAEGDHRLINIDDPKISRRHARVIAQHGAWYVEDLGSSNGTSLNGELVTRAALPSRSVVTLYEGGGEITLQISSGGGETTIIAGGAGGPGS